MIIIGDGIRENMEELASYIHRNTNLDFTLGLIEIPVYKNPDEDELIITPRILAKTKEIERIIYRVSESISENTGIEQKEETSQTISETVFFERLEKAIGKEKVPELKVFFKQLSLELNIVTKLGRGKRLSLLNRQFNPSIFLFAICYQSAKQYRHFCYHVSTSIQTLLLSILGMFHPLFIINNPLSTILAGTINLGLSKMAESSPATTYAEPSWLQAWHIRNETYSAEMACLVNAQSSQPIASY